MIARVPAPGSGRPVKARRNLPARCIEALGSVGEPQEAYGKQASFAEARRSGCALVGAKSAGSPDLRLVDGRNV